MGSKLERRNTMALDDAYHYLRGLEEGSERPSLHKLCSAIATVDRVLEPELEPGQAVNLSTEVWTCVRDGLFNQLVASFPGGFTVYCDDGGELEPGSDWPDRGLLEFFPDRTSRKSDSYTARLERLDPQIALALRWCFADGRQVLKASDLNEPPARAAESCQDEPADEARQLIERFYAVCEEESTKGKKKAHRKWWQLYWEADTCQDRKAKHKLQKEMLELQSVWGRPH